MSNHNNTQLEPPDRLWLGRDGLGDVGHQGQGRAWYSMSPHGGTVEYVRAAVAAPQGDALALIAQERQRQITQEGYDAEHDDNCHGHSAGEIAQAAAAYALGGGRVQNIDGSRVIDLWPTAWGAEEDTIKRKPRIRQLVIAGALIAAEIERLQRKGVAKHGD